MHESIDFVRGYFKSKYQYGVHGEYDVVNREKSEGAANIEPCQV